MSSTTLLLYAVDRVVEEVEALRSELVTVTARKRAKLVAREIARLREELDPSAA